MPSFNDESQVESKGASYKYRVIFVPDGIENQIENNKSLSEQDRAVAIDFVKRAFRANGSVSDTGTIYRHVPVDRLLASAVIERLVDMRLVLLCDKVTAESSESFRDLTLRRELFNGLADKTRWEVRSLPQDHGKHGIQLKRLLESAPDDTSGKKTNTRTCILFSTKETAIIPWYFHFTEEDARKASRSGWHGEHFLLIDAANSAPETEDSHSPEDPQGAGEGDVPLSDGSTSTGAASSGEYSSVVQVMLSCNREFTHTFIGRPNSPTEVVQKTVEPDKVIRHETSFNVDTASPFQLIMSDFRGSGSVSSLSGLTATVSIDFVFLNSTEVTPHAYLNQHSLPIEIREQELSQLLEGRPVTLAICLDREKNTIEQYTSAGAFGQDLDPQKAANEDGALTLALVSIKSGSAIASGVEKTVDRRNVRAVLEAYIASASEGDAANAAHLESEALTAQKLNTMMADYLDVQKLKIATVYVDDPENPTHAVATSERAEFYSEGKQSDGKIDGFMVFKLDMSETGWRVIHLDFLIDDSLDRQFMEKFIEANPTATSVPAPTASEALKSPSGTTESEAESLVPELGLWVVPASAIDVFALDVRRNPPVPGGVRVTKVEPDGYIDAQVKAGKLKKFEVGEIIYSVAARDVTSAKDVSRNFVSTRREGHTGFFVTTASSAGLGRFGVEFSELLKDPKTGEIRLPPLEFHIVAKGAAMEPVDESGYAWFPVRPDFRLKKYDDAHEN
jgi:hypothetical protein